MKTYVISIVVAFLVLIAFAAYKTSEPVDDTNQAIAFAQMLAHDDLSVADCIGTLGHGWVQDSATCALYLTKHDGSASFRKKLSLLFFTAGQAWLNPTGRPLPPTFGDVASFVADDKPKQPAPGPQPGPQPGGPPGAPHP